MEKIKIRNNLIIAFGSIVICWGMIFAIGWYAVELFAHTEDALIMAHKMESKMLECRREEKNIIIRGPLPDHIAKWSGSFEGILSLSEQLEKKRYIKVAKFEALRLKLSEYRGVFDDFIRNIKASRQPDQNMLHSYDAKFLIFGRVMLGFKDDIISDLTGMRGAGKFNIIVLFFVIFILGSFITVFLGYKLTGMILRFLKDKEELNRELEETSLELALGLSEHFEVMKQVAAGNLNVKAPMDSKNELLAKLGVSINQTIEKLLLFSQRELEQVYVVAASGIRVIDKGFNVVRSNKAMADICRRDVEVALGTKCYEQFNGPYCHTDQCTLKQILNGIPKIQAEVEKVRADGTKMDVLLRAIPFRNVEGKIDGIIEDFTDISELKKTQGELEKNSIELAIGVSEIFEVLRKAADKDLSVRASEQNENELLSKLGEVVNRTIQTIKDAWDGIEASKLYIENILNSMTDILIVTDVNANIILVNKAVMNVLGYLQEDLVGKEVACIVADAGMFEKDDFQRLLRTDEAHSFELSFKAKDGSFVPMLFSVVPMKDKENIVKGLIGIAKDISERKEIEKNRRLTELGRIAANVAHEVNNPLMIVSGRAQISLLDETADQKLKDNLNIIAEQCIRAKRIIERLLIFSKPNRADAAKDANINDVIEEVAAILEYQFKLNAIEIKRNYAQSLPQLRIDAQQMQEVFLNLLNNAHDAMPQGGVIEITTSCPGGGDLVKVEIRDTGVGMDKEIRESLFKPFFTTKNKGTGLGLSISYNIIRAHKGEISLESSPGQGTRITILLPINKGNHG